MSNDWLDVTIGGYSLAALQFLAALPWLLAVTRESRVGGKSQGFWALFLGWFLGGLIVAGGSLAVGLYSTRDMDFLSNAGRFYGVALQLQLTLDFFVVVFAVMLRFWPKGGAVALAAFREGVRQPMFWFIVIISLVIMILMPFLPYFTFGEDQKMVKEMGYDIIMIGAVLFGLLAASMSISEEIEGRTAITLMSKPISRRQFLLGKYFGILLASLLMTGLIGLVFFLILWFKPIYDHETVANPPWLGGFIDSLVPKTFGESGMYFAGGAIWWCVDAVMNATGLLLGSCQVMFLLAVAVALATRVPMVVNMIVCLVVFFLGNLTPTLVHASKDRYPLVRFMAQLLDTLLPGFEYFSLGAVLTRDNLPSGGPFAIYIVSVLAYAVLFSVMALLGGLILFEDRDLA